MTNNEITVKVEHVTKTFGDFTAVKDLSSRGSSRANLRTAWSKRRRQVDLDQDDRQHHRTGLRKLSSCLVARSADQLQDRIGYLPEERGLYKSMKVVDQLRFFAELKNVKGKDADVAN